VLGGSFTSRLNDDLRESKGYTYGISSGNSAYRDLGAWTVSTDVRTAVTAPALQEILEQMDKMRAAAPSAQELSGAKNYINGNFVLGLETQGQVAGAMMTQGLYGLPPDWLATYVHSVTAVTGDEALAAAQEVIEPAHALVVVVGDVKQIEAGLANLAPGTMLTIFNDQGEVVGTYPPEKPAGGGPSTTIHPPRRP
jgi:zinc protease